MAKRGPKMVDWRPAFLRALSAIPNVTAAAETAGIARQTAYDARKAHEDFAGAWEGALEEGVDRMELEAHRRAVKGVARGVYHNGERIAKEKHYSDTLMIFLLKAHRPARFRDNRRVDVNMSGGLDITSRSIVFRDPEPEEDAGR